MGHQNAWLLEQRQAWMVEQWRQHQRYTAGGDDEYGLSRCWGEEMWPGSEDTCVVAHLCGNVCGKSSHLVSGNSFGTDHTCRGVHLDVNEDVILAHWDMDTPYHTGDIG